MKEEKRRYIEIQKRAAQAEKYEAKQREERKKQQERARRNAEAEKQRRHAQEERRRAEEEWRRAEEKRQQDEERMLHDRVMKRHYDALRIGSDAKLEQVTVNMRGMVPGSRRVFFVGVCSMLRCLLLTLGRGQPIDHACRFGGGTTCVVFSRCWPPPVVHWCFSGARFCFTMYHPFLGPYSRATILRAYLAFSASFAVLTILGQPRTDAFRCPHASAFRRMPLVA